MRADGGTPMAVSADRYTSEFFAAPSPDGRRSRSPRGATARRSGGATATRTSTSPSSGCCTTARHAALRAADRTRRASSGGRCGAADGKSLFYVSDRSGAQNMLDADAWRRPQRQVTQFNDGRVLWPTHLVRRADDRLRARLRDLELDTASGRGGEVADHAVAARRPPRRSSTSR